MSAPKKASAKRSSAKKKKGDPNERVLTAAQEAKVRQAFKTHCEDPFSGATGPELSAIREALGLDSDLEACISAVEAFAPNGMPIDSVKKHLAQAMADAATRAELQRAFKLFDPRGTGRITRRSLKETSVEIGEKLTDDSILEMIQVAGGMKKGYITEEEFVNFMMEAWSTR